MPDQLVPECARLTEQYPCGCELIDLMQLVQNIINLSVYLATLVLVLLLVYVGFLYVTNPANPANRTKAKSVAISGIIGFVLVLGAFLIVSTVMNTFADKDQYGNWNSFFNVTRSSPEMCVNEDLNINTGGGNGGGGVTVGGGNNGGGNSSGGGSGTLTCSNCVSVEGASFDHKPPGTGGVGGFGCNLTLSQEEIDYCQLNRTVFGKLNQLQRNFSGAWRVNEMWPPTVTHSNPCHNAGTCVDAAPVGATSADTEVLADFILAARRAGLYPVWEDRAIRTREQCNDLLQELRSHGAFQAAIEYGIPVAPHFSLYNTVGSTGCFD